MNLTTEPEMTLSLSCGCVVILGGSTKEEKGGRRGRDWEEGIAASDRMNTRSVQVQTIHTLIRGPLYIS